MIDINELLKALDVCGRSEAYPDGECKVCPYDKYYTEEQCCWIKLKQDAAKAIRDALGVKQDDKA